MPYTILVHVLNEDAVVGEVDELPDPHSQFIIINSPRLRDGRQCIPASDYTNEQHSDEER